MDKEVGCLTLRKVIYFNLAANRQHTFCNCCSYANERHLKRLCFGLLQVCTMIIKLLMLLFQVYLNTITVLIFVKAYIWAFGANLASSSIEVSNNQTIKQSR